MARGDTLRYGFAVGRVMVLRTRLLGPATFERLLDAPTFEDQVRVLGETHLARFLEGVRTATEVERAIDASLADMYEEFLERAELPRPVIEYFRVPYDFARLRGALKQRVLGAPEHETPAALGTLRDRSMSDPGALPGAIGEVARAVLAAGPALSAEQIDVRVDRALFMETRRLARASGIAALERLAAREADVANAKVLLRSALAGRPAADAAAMLVPGGAWDGRAFVDMVRRPEQLADALVAARVLPAATAAELLDPVRIDVFADAAIARVAREAARGDIGPAPVIGYLLQRRAEAIAVRAVLVGRLAGLPRETIAARIRVAS